jgi:hypothetical protein
MSFSIEFIRKYTQGQTSPPQRTIPHEANEQNETTSFSGNNPMGSNRATVIITNINDTNQNSGLENIVVPNSVTNFLETMHKRYPETKTSSRMTILNLLSNRPNFVDEYGWAIPEEQTLTAIKKFAQGEKSLELAAGKGTWGNLLRAMGMNIVLTDKVQNQNGNVLALTADQALDIHNNANLLFTCWPEDGSELWLADALSKFKGDKFAYIGEDRGGSTAGDDVFDKLDSEWEKVETISMKHWYGMNDQLILYKRKPTEKTH